MNHNKLWICANSMPAANSEFINEFNIYCLI